MAFSNVFGNTYTIVSEVQLMTKERSASIRLKSYTDSSKTEELSEFDIWVSGNSDGLPIKKAFVNSLPNNAKEGDMYLVGDNPTKDVVEYKNCVVGFNGLTWDILDIDCVYDLDKNTYDNQGGKWTRSRKYLSPGEFDKWFSPEASNAEGKNIIERCYEYLKTRPEFSLGKDS